MVRVVMVWMVVMVVGMVHHHMLDMGVYFPWKRDKKNKGRKHKVRKHKSPHLHY